MTNREFRHLSRADLIEIIYQLQQSEKAVREENEVLRQKLADRRVAIEESGSLAEVLAKLNGLFEAAQATADDYREEARRMREQASEYLSDTQHAAQPDPQTIPRPAKEGRHDDGYEGKAEETHSHSH